MFYLAQDTHGPMANTHCALILVSIAVVMDFCQLSYPHLLYGHQHAPLRAGLQFLWYVHQHALSQ